MYNIEILKDFQKFIENNEVNKTYTIGIAQRLIYSNEVFKNNKDIVPFLETIFNQSYLPYVIKSRTLIAAKLGRFLANTDENEFPKINKDIIHYFKLDIDKNLNKKVKSKRKNSNEKLDAWLRGI